MRFEDVFSTRAASLRIQQDASNGIAYMARAFFPDDKQMSLELKNIHAKNGLGVMLKPSAFDTLATIRTRQGFTVNSMEMPLFREGFMVTEKDIMDIQRAADMNDPYLMAAVRNVYNDAENLTISAEVAAEMMRCSLMAPIDGNVTISVQADNAIYNYDYDPNHAWKATNYVALTGNSRWNQPSTAKPLEDLRTAKKQLEANGFDARYAVMNEKTWNYLADINQIKNAIVTISGVSFDFVDDETVRTVFTRRTGLIPVIYNKKYKDLSGNDVNFFPDDYVSVITSRSLGRTVYAPTPEERTLLNDPKVDVSIIGAGVALSRQTTYGPPVQNSIYASMIALPSFENMDGMYTLKVVSAA